VKTQVVSTLNYVSLIAHIMHPRQRKRAPGQTRPLGSRQKPNR
jgi:hypothetical protein